MGISRTRQWAPTYVIRYIYIFVSFKCVVEYFETDLS